MSPPEPLLARFATSESQADEWRLCLVADGIEAAVDWTEAGYVVVIDPDVAPRAIAIIDEYDAEQRERRALAARPLPPEFKSHLGAWSAVVLIALHALSLLDRRAWLDVGRANAGLIQAGEWWRITSALFLHGDYMHVFSNSVAALVLFTALGKMVGTARALVLILISASLGNLINAYAHDATFSSIGASTATFASIGLLAVHQFLRRNDTRMKRWWPPLAAALGLFAMLGTGKETDVFAHLFGLLAGVVVGGIAVVVGRAKAPEANPATLH